MGIKGGRRRNLEINRGRGREIENKINGGTEREEGG